jgi:aspartyl-tRNA(Asn)/glutamyl-tRNA(Gln) amidotransferase subunit A
MPMISFTEDRQRFLDGSLLVSQRVEQCLAAIEAQQELNAFLHVDADGVRTAAAASDERYRAGLARPLEGCIVAVKDNMSVRGMPMTCASRILEGFMPLYTATVVERLVDAGALVIGKTNMDEFAMGSSSETSAYGVVRNPHDSNRVPGGSSGGSAVAVAAGMCHVSLGSDTGGSIRQPAAFCGVVGFKPTYGAVSRYGLTAFASSLDHVGPFAPSIADTQAVFDVMAGIDAMDSTSVLAPEAQSVPPIKELRVGVLGDDYIGGCDRSIQDAYAVAIEKLSQMGAAIVPIQLQHEAAWVPTYFILATAEASSNLARFDGVRYGKRFDSEVDIVAATRSRGFGTEVQRRIMLGTYVLSSGYHDAYYTRAQKARRLIANMYNDVFTKVDVILMPTTPTPAFELGAKQADPVAMWLSDYYTVSANIAGIPAVSVPAGTDGAGLPIGLQVQGPIFADALVLEVAGRI